MANEKTTKGFDLETVRVSSLRPHPRNYRKHPEDQIDHLARSIEENGVYRNIVVAKDYTILAGHGVVEALTRLGVEEVPVYRLDLDPNEPRALKVLTGDNEIEHLAMQDDRALSEILKEIQSDTLTDLLGTGYDDMMLANLVFVTRPASEIEDFDEATHWVGVPEYDSGIPQFRLGINFLNEGARLDLLERLGLTPAAVDRKTRDNLAWSMWWPPREQDDLESVFLEGDGVPER